MGAPASHDRTAIVRLGLRGALLWCLVLLNSGPGYVNGVLRQCYSCSGDAYADCASGDPAKLARYNSYCPDTATGCTTFYRKDGRNFTTYPEGLYAAHYMGINNASFARYCDTTTPPNLAPGQACAVRQLDGVPVWSCWCNATNSCNTQEIHPGDAAILDRTQGRSFQDVPASSVSGAASMAPASAARAGGLLLPLPLPLLFLGVSLL